MQTTQRSNKAAFSTRHDTAKLSERCRQVGRAARSAGRFGMETLESRTLMSASAWGTSDFLPGQPGNNSQVQDMAADRFGNVYAIGSNNGLSPLLRMKAAGSDVWTTLSLPGTFGSLGDIATDGQGNLFISAASATGQSLLQRSAATGAITIVDQTPGMPYNCVTADSAGNVVVGGTLLVQTGTSGKGKNATPVYTNYPVIRQRLAGQSAFNVVVDGRTSGSPFAGFDLRSIGIVEGGASAGVYAVGNVPSASNGWFVLKSLTGAAGTWTTVDRYTTGTAVAVSSDNAGNVYVAGSGTVPGTTGGHFIVRKSSDGGAHWTVSDKYQLTAGSTSSLNAMTRDAAGNLFVAGQAMGPGGWHAIVRTNVGGTWHTIDDYKATTYDSFNDIVVDTAGTVYAGGYSSGPWLVRSGPSGAGASQASAPTSLSAKVQSVNISLVTVEPASTVDSDGLMGKKVSIL